MSENNLPVVEKEDLKDVTPERLHEKIEWDTFHQGNFSHREEECRPNGLISYMGAAIENHCIMVGDSSVPSVISEIKAVRLAVKAVSSKYPTWFDNTKLPDKERRYSSDIVLSEGMLIEKYWCGNATPDTKDIDGNSWEDQKEIIIPIAGLILTAVDEQKKHDKKARTKRAKDDIQTQVVSIAYEHDLEDDEINAAVNNAVRKLREAKV